MDCFLLGPAFAPCFWTRKPALPNLEGLGGVVALLLLLGASFSGLLSTTASGSDVPHRHFCFLGMAAVTAAHEQGRDEGCGQELNGRPGFRTGTISRSLACVHLVERWPRMQGSLHYMALATMVWATGTVAQCRQGITDVAALKYPIAYVPGHLLPIYERHFKDV